MAVETLFPNGDDNGWPTGDWTDIDESIASADGAVMSTNTKNDVVIIDLDDSAITDADTVNTVTVKIRARSTGSGGRDSLGVDVSVGGAGLGEVDTDGLTGTFATYTLTNSLWDLDHTAAQMDAMQLTITSKQSGMAAAADWEIDAIDVDVDYTASATGRIMSSLAGPGGLAGAGGIAGKGGGLAG